MRSHVRCPFKCLPPSRMLRRVHGSEHIKNLRPGNHSTPRLRLNQFQVNQRQDETPEQLLSVLAGEVSNFSKSVSLVVVRAFPNLENLDRSDVCKDAIRASVDTVLYMQLYAPVMEVLHKVYALEDTQCDLQLKLIGGTQAQAADFKVRDSLQLGYDAYSTVHALMFNFSGIQVRISPV